MTYVGRGIDEPLSVQQDGVVSFFHADGLGSIVGLTNAAGLMTVNREYDAWGNLQVGNAETGYAFTGREWDPEVSLYYYRARYYDAKVGRFLSEDRPEAEEPEGQSLYPYVGSNPVSAVDPSGWTKVVVSSNCGANRKKVEKAARKAEKAIKRCLSCEEKDRLRDTDTIVIQCTTTLTDIWGQDICAERIVGRPMFFLTPAAFLTPVCGCLEATLMHEALHIAGRGNDKHNAQGGFDDVQKCIPCAKER